MLYVLTSLVVFFFFVKSHYLNALSSMLKLTHIPTYICHYSHRYVSSYGLFIRCHSMFVQRELIAQSVFYFIYFLFSFKYKHKRSYNCAGLLWSRCLCCCCSLVLSAPIVCAHCRSVRATNYRNSVLVFKAFHFTNARTNTLASERASSQLRHMCGAV